MRQRRETMAEVNWTGAQERAITIKDKSVIVSAAAGSGKTSVLVERIIRRICDEQNPLKVDRLLVVTFTKAAANEMRQRLGEAIDEKLAEDPKNRFLLRQKAMLPMADICNMDKYFLALVRDNFHTLGITPDFRMLDDSETKLLKLAALDETLEKYYDEKSEQFDKLRKTVGDTEKDKNLSKAIETLSNYSDAFADPEEWLNNVKESYKPGTKISETVFGEALFDVVEKRADYAALIYKKGMEYIEGVELLKTVYELFANEIKMAEEIKAICKRKDWDELLFYLNAMSFATFKAGSEEAKQLPEKDVVKEMRDNAKGKLNDIKKFAFTSYEAFQEDCEQLYPIVSTLIDTVFEYRRLYTQKKEELNAKDFNDVTHLALNLLIDDGKPSDMALELRGHYDEILIDEYQDTNDAQDSIFTALSKDETNLFIVGDIKQSIYGFRLAMPQLFLNKLDKWREDSCEYADYVNLDDNFRSRKSILSLVNYVFSRSMSKAIGDIDYNNEHALKYGAKYNEDGVQSEIYLLDRKALPDDYTEMQFIADRIEDILANECVYNVKEKTARKATPRDICVLFKANKKGLSLLRELRNRDIPAYVEVGEDFFDNREVSNIVSLLRIIDNPLLDVHMLAVLMSPLFGFDADELSEMRINNRFSNLFELVKRSPSEKAKHFLEEYKKYRRLSTVSSVRNLIRTIYEDTGYLYAVSADANGSARRLNLLLLLDYAANYEENSPQGLAGFVRHIDRCIQNEKQPEGASGASQNADVINIMTIHKSKGLEFPFVILGALAGEDMNERASDIKIHEKTGVGIKVFDVKQFKKYDTVQFTASNEKCKENAASEALRVLYVAMTRAKEKLIMTASIPDLESRLKRIGKAAMLGDKLHPLEVRNTESFIDLILKTMIKHRDLAQFREKCDYKLKIDTDPGFAVKAQIISEPVRSVSQTLAERERQAKPDSKTLDMFRQRVQYEYPYTSLSTVPTKKAASSFNDSYSNRTFFAKSIPNFASKDGVSSAGRGTATHRFMEVCDFEAARSDIEAEIERLVSEGKLSLQQADVLDRNAILKFFESELYKRIKAADNVWRELRFTVFAPLKFLDSEKGSRFPEEKILVQGIIDCAFEENGKLVVLDYKTDKVGDTETLSEMYSNQLLIYKDAAEQSLSMNVSQLLLYSFELGEQKEIEMQ